MTILVVMADKVAPTVEQARAFCAAASSHTYAEAAAALHTTDRVSVIHLVDRFTRAVGRGRLIVATRRGVISLTAAGAEVAEAARLYVYAADALASTSPNFRLSTFPAIASQLAQRAPGLFEGRPRLTLNHVSDTNRSDGGLALIDRLLTGEVDLVVAPNGRLKAGLQEWHIYDWALRVVLPKRDARRSAEVLAPEELRSYRIVVTPRGHLSRSLAEGAFAADRVPFEAEMESTDQTLLRSLAEAGTRFAALLPDDAFGAPQAALGPRLATKGGTRLGGGYSLYLREPARQSEAEDERSLILANLAQEVLSILAPVRVTASHTSLAPHSASITDSFSSMRPGGSR